jgi:hypothetical protein
MPSSWNIADLEIIGYADSRDETMLPAIVPPVFRSIADSSTVLVPPYTLEFATVIDATRISMEEADHLGAVGELTLTPSSRKPAQPGFQLWLSRDGELIYQPLDEASLTLSRLSEQAVQRATKELREGNLDLAEESASEAILSDDRRVEAYAIKAAICRRLSDHPGEELMAELARPLFEASAFGTLVDHYFVLTPRVGKNTAPATGVGPMDRIATEFTRAA